MANFDPEDYVLSGPMFEPSVQKDGELLYLFMVSHKDKIPGRLELGYAVLFEPSGHCAVTIGGFPLKLYVEIYAAEQDGKDTPTHGVATSYCSVDSSDIGQFRDKLREIIKDYVPQPVATFF